MPRQYAAIGSGSAGTNKTFLVNQAPATTRGWLYDIILGHDATPADLAGKFVVARHTASGTGTAVTPLALDPGNPASLFTAAHAQTIEPTYTAGGELLQISLNQRATFRWISAPGGELVVPISNGLGLKSLTHGGTPTTTVTFHWVE